MSLDVAIGENATSVSFAAFHSRIADLSKRVEYWKGLAFEADDQRLDAQRQRDEYKKVLDSMPKEVVSIAKGVNVTILGRPFFIQEGDVIDLDFRPL